jgi:dTDP-glucose 4,6-dehydratase
MAKLLVSGGAGFIGANFVRYWAAHHPDDLLVVIDALTYAGDRANLAGAAHQFVHGDIRDTDLVRRLIRDHALDTIVHFAAETHVDRSIAGPDPFIQANVVGTHNLLTAARAEWIDKGSGRPHRFHHISTDEVYGSLGPGDPAFTESTPYAPNSPYAASKAASDHLVRAYHRTYGLETTLTACSNNYGPFQCPEKLIPLFLRNCLTGRALPIYGDGMNVRDWLHVDDHVRALELALQRGKPGETYNVGGGQELSNLALVDALCAAVDRSFASEPRLAKRFPGAPAARGEPSASLKSFVPDRPGHDRRYAIDDAKARRELGYYPQRSFAPGLEETVAWYVSSQFPNEGGHVRPLP